MDLVRHNPTTGVYPATPDYVHAMEVRNPGRFLYVSGTMGLDPRGVAGAGLAEVQTLRDDWLVEIESVAAAE